MIERIRDIQNSSHHYWNLSRYKRIGCKKNILGHEMIIQINDITGSKGDMIG